MNLRQAGASLIGVISILVISHAFGGDLRNVYRINSHSLFESRALISMAEQCEAGNAKSIHVTNFPPDIQKRAVRVEIGNICLAQLYALRSNHFGAGLNYDVFSEERTPNGEVFARSVSAQSYVNEPSHISRGDLSDVPDSDVRHALGGRAVAVGPERLNPMRADGDVGAQLLRGGFLRITNQTLCCAPQQPSGNEQPKGENNQKRIGNLKSVAVERPELGSLLVIFVMIPLAFFIAGKGDDMWASGRRLCGAICLSVGLLLGLDATFGLLLGFDLWSLRRLL